MPTLNTAQLSATKTADRFVAYLNDIITYQIAIKNLGNLPADSVVITDPIPSGGALVPGSLVVSAPHTLLPGGIISLTNPIPPAATVTIAYQMLVSAMPNPNPIHNVAGLSYAFTDAPQAAVTVTGTSNGAVTTVFKNNYGQQISDLIASVALEQAALAAIANAEGAKIQRMAAMPDITTQQLLCLNQSVADMTDSIALLESVLKQKLALVACQISGESC